MKTHLTKEQNNFGRTGKWGYDDVVNILFEEKRDLIADFICSKIYRYFVSPQANQNIIGSMAAHLSKIILS